ncbi:MAG: iron chelate uptake ABC transporter family permease subunit [Eggerthellaceae bacterium]|nr:iron chelate uptake ABC transporter family permease subunit [Eggerthellaceae bacterium]
MPIGYEDRAILRRKTVLVGVAAIAMLLLCLCVDDYKGRLAPPTEVLSCYVMWFQQAYASIFDPGSVLSGTEMLAFNQSYFSIMARAGVTVITALGGMLLALAGSLYQTVFRNPIASPSMLGVSSGIQLGVLLLVLLFGSAATTLGGLRYCLCYGCALGVLALLFATSRLISGKGKPLNVVNMLVVGTLISQLIGVVTTYVTWYLFDDDLWEVYNSINEALSVDTSWYAFAFLFGSALLSVVPVFVLRFRLNCLSFDEADMRLMGVNPYSVQLIALACGTIMMIGAQVSVGTVSMLSLVVPHISRAFFGAEFRKQLIGNVLIGAFIMLTCRVLLSFIPKVGLMLPIGTMVSVLVLPAFVWMIAIQQRSWE